MLEKIYIINLLYIIHLNYTLYIITILYMHVYNIYKNNNIPNCIIAGNVRTYVRI